jgi:osmotically-inducible protein OsmY
MKQTIVTLVCTVSLLGGPVVGRVLASQSAAAKAGSHATEEQIEHRIHDDSILKQHDVKVSVSDGVVTLTGTVATTAQRSRAARLANVKGITRVDNQIVVERTASGTSGSIDRAAEKTKSGTSKAIDKTKEGLEKVVGKTKEGVAVAAEKTGQGVRKAGSETSDAALLASVKTRLFGDDALKGSDINVDCDAKVITLRGTVPSEASRARALDLARKVEGVSRVVDHLTIGPKK